ncbi:MAG TPA: four helix bundle protein [Cyclobacteriaceae bacterium]|nr:four helix bundle protein [Cyclobacteriaceae bacterium]HMV09553.1 four helix bundle protein [Cyclobacteriaceae bacterium]HMV91241.1 four helix bundle protein [Cyclobacteriaceae bacterium]HMX01984.1 four helix bundle protein [Cyclobacteriaceae bacterium]HMX51853.1 four helix bundle protein [Cyclobacteriaceae bacterium]
MKTFEELDCWKRANTLRVNLSTLVKSFPSEERFRLTDQIIRASRSVTANIAEGYGRFHYQEYTQFCRQSRGSLYELMDHLIVASDERYITGEQLNDYKQQISDCLAVLNGFINYLKKAKLQNSVNEPEERYHLTINK